ncbi:MacS family sensor histidine kinase [Micromonospora sp. LOL_023]|uniref:MacS family sensor histidine kinase n=1 Tax=Micromonospora sp. LOL_023 TaxID=3345418 RepID=UPI003A886A86
MRGTPSPAGTLIVPLWRAIAVFRFAALGYVLVLYGRNAVDYAHPVVAIPVLLAMVAWTIVATWAYARPRWRRWPLLAADLLIALATLLVSPWIIGRAVLADGVPTLGVAWLAGPVLAWAVAGGRRLGVVAALVLATADLAVRERLNESSVTPGVLMLLAGVVVGHVARLIVAAEDRLQRAVELEAATRELAAATRERERLARDIHDSVLQVLAMVARRGADLDGEAGELARLAGEQEAALRTLVTSRVASSAAGSAPLARAAAGSAPLGRAAAGSEGRASAAGADGVGAAGAAADGAGAGAGTADLRTVIARYAAPRVSIAEPAGPVLLSGHVAAQLGAALGAAVDNAIRHGGPDVQVWVLVEQEPDAVTVSVRDDGRGIAPGRLAEAAAQGRLGVSQSIRGRIAEVGGTVRIVSAPGEGTEIELRVPGPVPC